MSPPIDAQEFARNREVDIVRDAVRDVIQEHVGHLKEQMKSNHDTLLAGLAEVRTDLTDIKKHGCQQGAANHSDILSIQKDMKRASGIVGGVVAVVFLLVEKILSHVFRSSGG
jgi:hypothetical protein